MGLWCGHAVLPFPSFNWVFLFHLLGQVGLALVSFFALSLLSLFFYFYFCFSFFLFAWICLVLGCLCLYGGFFFVLCSDLLSFFPRDFLLPPRSGVLRGSCLLFFFFEVFLSAFEISFSSRPFLFFGGEVWPGPSVFSPALGSVDSSLGSGKFVLLSLPGPLAVQLRFFFRFFFLCMWFRQTLGVSSVRRSLWWSAGCSVPGTFCWCCGILSSMPEPVGSWERLLFCLLSSACGFLFTAFSRQLVAIGVLFVVFLLVVA